MPRTNTPKKPLGVMIAFKPPPEALPGQRTRFYRRLTGYIDHSNYGKFKYKRPGLLNKVPHINPVDSLIIIRPEHEDEVVSLLNSEGATIYARRIILEDEDMEQLSKLPEKDD